MTDLLSVPRVRSALYVPGQRADFLAKAHTRGADALIIDLEDSVPEAKKAEGRALTGEWIAGRPGPTGPAICVRINALEDSHLEADLAAIVDANLTAVVVPKVRAPDDVRLVAEGLAYQEGRKGLPPGHVRIWPLVETAAAVQNAAVIATASSRIAYMGGGTGRDGDLARDIRYRWSVGGAETMYIRSKVLVDVRAAGVPNPVSGLVGLLDDPDAVRSFAEQARSLGYEGVMVIHPSHVAIANEVFTPSDEEVREARAVIDALAAAEARGQAAIVHGDRMIDTPNAEAARRLLDEAQRLTSETAPA